MTAHCAESGSIREGRGESRGGARYVLICGAGQFTGTPKLEKMTTQGKSNHIVEPIHFNKDCSSFRLTEVSTIEA